MSLGVDQFPGIESKWDIPHIMRNDSNILNAWIFTAKLSPTAVTPANWVLLNPDSVVCFIWDIDVSSDTAIEVSWGNNGADPNFTSVNAAHNGVQGGPTLASKTEAQVAASVAFSNQLGGAFIPAGGLTHLLNKTWLSANQSSALYVHTSAVAANVYVTYYFAEYNSGP